MIRLTFETCKNGCYETGIKEFTDEEYQNLLNDKGEVIMSVPAYNRELSTMEYISKAQELLNLTVELCLKMSKKYTYFGRAKTYEYAREIMDSLLIANSLNVKTDYEQRTKYLKRALGLLTCLSNHLMTIMPYIKFQKTIIDKNGEKQTVENGEKKQKKLTLIAILISDCEKLTKGVIKKDKERLGV